MINNSTLLFIMDGLGCDGEIIDINEFLDLKDDCTAELDALLDTLDYSPSDEVINRILLHI